MDRVLLARIPAAVRQKIGIITVSECAMGATDAQIRGTTVTGNKYRLRCYEYHDP